MEKFIVMSILNDTKRVGKRIKIIKEISISELVQAHVEWVKEQVDWENAYSTNKGDKSAATNTGYNSAATNKGNKSAATNKGDKSAATNTGNYSAATNTGDNSAATNTGYNSSAEVSGNDSVAISTGMDSRVKGAIGCAIVCVEREHENGEMIAIKSAIVDGKTIKADTWYTVECGEWVEVCG